MEELFTFNSMAALATLALLEIVLGIDNVVFLAILTGKLPEAQQPKARTLGLVLAAVGRIALLFAISWVITLDKTVLFDLPFHMPGSHPVVAEIEPGEEQAAVTPVKSDDPSEIDSPAVVEALEEGGTPITAKDIVLILGGLFLLGKSTWEIGHQLEPHHTEGGGKVYSSLSAVLMQIIAIDLDEGRLEVARRFGATATVNSGDADAAAAVMKLTQDLGVDTAIEAVGLPVTFELCQQIVAAGGTIANVGVHGVKVDLHLEKLWDRNITITTRLVDTVSTPMLLKILHSHQLDPKPLITHRFKLDQIIDAYETFAHASDTHALKVLIEA